MTCGIEKLLQFRLREDQSGRVDQGMTSHFPGFSNILIQKEFHLALGIVDQGKNGDGAGLHSKMLSQSLRRAEAQLGPDRLAQSLEIDRLVMMSNHQKMTFAFAVSQEEILGVDVDQVRAVLGGLLASKDGWMILPPILDLVLGQVVVEEIVIDCHRA